MKTLYGVLAAIGVLFLVAGSTAATTEVQAPTNLEVIAATEDSITIAWGPSQPGEFVILDQPRKNALTIGWGASEDTRSAVAYRFEKNGTLLATGLNSPQYTVTGIGAKVKSFRICVTAYTVDRNLQSPTTCGTITKI